MGLHGQLTDAAYLPIKCHYDHLISVLGAAMSKNSLPPPAMVYTSRSPGSSMDLPLHSRSQSNPNTDILVPPTRLPQQGRAARPPGAHASAGTGQWVRLELAVETAWVVK